jgi:glycine betaine/proline transport system substrate-binding protein
MTGSSRRRFPAAGRLGPLLICGALAVFTAAAPAARAADTAREHEACRTVRLADIGWTDVTATTALVARLLRDLGYQADITVLSVPVTYASMKNKDIDVFLGNWMPSMEADRKPFVEDRSVEVIGANLTGAKYTLAVPAYTHAAGLRDFADIKRFSAALKSSIYGIEPGNDGNRLVLKLIEENQFELGDFKLVESSEQGMLAEVERAFRAREPIVFLAWNPHPMNMRFDLRYLTGGDATFGPNFGGAAVYTNTRAGYSAACPNVGRLLANLSFTTAGESQLMAAILDDHLPPDTAAARWIAANHDLVAGWLAGVSTWDARPGRAALEQAVQPKPTATFEAWITTHKVPVGDTVTALVEQLKAHGMGFFDGVSLTVHASIDAVNALLGVLPAPALIAAIALLAWLLRRSIPLAVFVALSLLFIMNQGYWAATLETLTLVLVAAFTATLLGVPLGIAAARRPGLYAVMRPILDLMQTLPTFVYLTPTLVLFGLGVVPGLISTVIFALPAPIRLTHLGISSVPKALLEAGQAFGATRLQLLWKVELPSAAPTIVAGITQCIMLSLSMVVIAALVGAGGLGVPVVRALNTVQVGMGFEAGLAIVLLAIILDRMTRPAESPGPG